MPKIKVYEYPKCSTCQKALRFLTRKKIDFDRVDITETPPKRHEIETMLEHYGGEVRKLFNTSGVVYREKKLGQKLPSLSTKDAVALLESNGRLVKRPFMLWKDIGLVGFREEEWEAAFRSHG